MPPSLFTQALESSCSGVELTIETAEVWQQLSDLGCDSLQGYFLARPLPAADVAGWLANYVSPALQNTSHA